MYHNPPSEIVHTDQLLQPLAHEQKLSNYKEENEMSLQPFNCHTDASVNEWQSEVGMVEPQAHKYTCTESTNSMDISPYA